MTVKVVPMSADMNWTDVEYYEWLTDMEEFIALQKNRTPLYFSFNDDRREGSIARSTTLEFQLDTAYGRWIRTGLRRKNNLGYAQVKWDKRSKKLIGYAYEINWLKGYEGSTVWAWDPHPGPKAPQFFPKDRTGADIKVGDFCLYVLHHFEKSGASTRFGTVTKIAHDGTVWAKNVKIGDDETVAEKRINDNETILVLTKDLLDRLMLLRLSSI
jgi:hypothetical protein